MRIALTGATGFLGTHLLPLLGPDAVAISRNPPKGGVRGDVTVPGQLDEAFAGCDVVVHAAGRVDHTHEGADLTWAVHVDGTQNVIDSCRRAGVKRLVHISSSGTVAVSADDRVHSEVDPAPVDLIGGWPYYRSKLRAEQLALAANDDTLQVVSLNPSLLLGPGDPDGSATSTVRWFLRGKLPVSPSGGLSFVDVRDTARAVHTLLTRGTPGHRYLVGAANWTFRDFYERLGRIAGLPAPWPTPRAASRLLRFAPNLGRDGFSPGYPMTRMDVDLASHFWWLDDTAARAELQWAPRDPLATLSDTVFDLRQRGLA